MSETKTHMDLNDALAGLLDKYAVEVPDRWQLIDGREPFGDDVLALVPGESLAEAELPDGAVPLLAWRHQRRFVELKNLIHEKTISPLLMCRFACLTDGQQLPLESILYREFDLIEWLSGAPIVGIYASMAANQNGPDPVFKAANAIVGLADGVIGSVEVSTTLPNGAAMQDRHEMIARRGVTSDRVVDTQVPQSSVYTWTDAGHAQYTDVDAELFGLDAEHVSVVRAAFEVLCRPELAAGLRSEHARLQKLVELAYESNRCQQRLTVAGGVV